MESRFSIKKESLCVNSQHRVYGLLQSVAVILVDGDDGESHG